MLSQHAPARPGVRSAVAHGARVGVDTSRGADCGLHLVAWNDASYPAALAAIADPPPGVVGARQSVRRSHRVRSPSSDRAPDRRTRSPSPNGSPADLAARGIVVVSGLARGVDSAAHRGALAAGGHDGRGARVRRRRHLSGGASRSRAARSRRDGAIVSELVPGTPPQQQFFPLRNRIISGLSRAVLIVEAGEKSGSLITARCALDQGRDVLAVPGNVLSGRNRGGHALLKDGAKIVESADDILEELGLPSARNAARRIAPEDPVLAGLPAGEPCDLDVLAERTGLASARLLPRLVRARTGRIDTPRRRRPVRAEFDKSC